ncbi:MAG: metalloregulator ArsR/SmtB family transcription factor [Croceibacterium sp.]
MINAELALDALGDRTRRRIFLRLRKRPRYAGDLASGMRVTRSAVSQHLQVLKAAGLVSVTVEGTRRLYQVDPAGLAALRKELDRFWSHTLTAYKEAVEQRKGK